MLRISAVIVALEEAGRLGAAVRSVRPWVDEVLVLDGGSQDRTVDEARAAGARVLVHPFDGFARQKQRATDAARHDLIVSLDADERVGPELGAAIARLSVGEGPLAGWRVRRLNYLDGRPLRASGWSPDLRVRVFDRRRARWEGPDPHDQVFVDGPVGELPGLLHHDPERTTAAYRAGTRAHAERRARSLAEAGARPSALSPWSRGAGHLLRKIVLRSAWLDGRRGWTVACVGAWGVVHKYRRARELS